MLRGSRLDYFDVKLMSNSNSACFEFDAGENEQRSVDKISKQKDLKLCRTWNVRFF